LSKAACHAVIVQKKRSAVKCGVNRQLQTIVSRPDQNAIKALLVGGWGSVTLNELVVVLLVMNREIQLVELKLVDICTV
jgi:hypothetical protein